MCMSSPKKPDPAPPPPPVLPPPTPAVLETGADRAVKSETTRKGVRSLRIDKTTSPSLSGGAGLNIPT